MTPEQLAALKEVARRAQRVAPGPLYDVPHPEYAGALHRVNNKPDSSWTDYGELANVVPGLAEFIAAFDPSTCLELLEEVERLTVENQLLKSIQSAYENGDEQLLEELESEQL